VNTNKTKLNYSNEFKEAAIAKCLEIGTSETSKQLGVARSTLNTWRRSLKLSSQKLSKPSYEDLEKENRRLKKEIGYIAEINEVLKKSTAIFCKDQMGGLR
jgi:transposase-like protein